jgi:rfaE bifunctional protein nucleotidyltransferase chain/domain/rfaE bifunctional protein kinase chain/domain
VSGPLIVVGDAMLDRDVEGRVERLCPDAPAPVVDVVARRARPGGAALAAALAAGDGHEVVLVTALGDDEAGAELQSLLGAAGVEVVDLGLHGGDTAEKIRVRSGAQTLVRLDRGSPGEGVRDQAARRARAVLKRAGGALVSDYGRGISSVPSLRDSLTAATERIPVVWDPHPRGDDPVPGVSLATPNAAEAKRFAAGPDGDGLPAMVARARELRERWHARAVAVTLGSTGAALVLGPGSPVVCPARSATGDPCGAGDRFASAAAGSLLRGASLAESVRDAVDAASAFVAAGGAGGYGSQPDVRPRTETGLEHAMAVATWTRARGGTVVATGGCFDLVHTGHIATLRAARALGDCLIVCLNSDRAVQRLKGPDRPLVCEDDRAAVLEALDCVDAVAVFSEDTPVELLDRLRPEIFAKGGDYAAADLPEAAALRRWGGEVAILPYLQEHSTTRLIQAAINHGR